MHKALDVNSHRIYKSGFFAFLCAAVLIGVLLGTVSFCRSQGEFLQKLGLAKSDFIASRQSLDYASTLVSSLAGTTVFLAAAFVCGLCAVGQPLELLILIFRGMGLGLTLSQMYCSYGKTGVLPTMGLILPGAVISTAAMIFAVREAMRLSNIYLGISLTDKPADGLMAAIKLYAAKFLVLEAAMAVSAGIDCICSCLFIELF